MNEMCRLTVNRCICCAIYKRTYVQISTNYIYDRDGNGNEAGAGAGAENEADNEVEQRGAQRLKGRSQWVSQREATFLSRWPLVHVIRKRNRVHEAARSLGLGSRLCHWLWLWPGSGSGFSSGLSTGLGAILQIEFVSQFFFPSSFFCDSFHFLQ